MPLTNSALNNSVGAPPLASFQLCTMCDANSSPHNVFDTSPKAASFTRNLCAMCDTDSSFLGMVVAILEATTFPLSAMGGTYSTPNDSVGTPLKATSLDFPLSAMRPTHSSLLYILHLWDNWVMYFMITVASGITGHGNGNDDWCWIRRWAAMPCGATNQRCCRHWRYLAEVTWRRKPVDRAAIAVWNQDLFSSCL